jgi:hypothetical protein
MSDPNTATTTASEGPVMSTGQTLTSIFFEPGEVFEALRVRPRFLIAAIIMTAALMLFTISFFQRVGFERVVTEAIETSPQAEQMSPEQKEQAIAMQSGSIFKGIYYGSPIIVMAIIISAGAGLYLLGSVLMGRSLSYKQALSVWTYSSMPPMLLAMLLNIILLFLRSPDDYDIVHASRRGLVQANLGLFVDPKASPILASLLGSFDLFAFYGLFLAALGLRKVAKMSSGSAWTVVLAIWVFGVIVRVAFAAITGGAM